VLVGNSLVDMYAKCGSIEDAWIVFNKMSSRDVVTWNAMILEHVKCGQGQKALQLFQQMQQENMQPDSVTFVAVLNACASIGALKEGRCAHAEIIQSGCESHVFVGNSLVDMYTKCGSIEDAWIVFNKMSSQDVVTWNAILGGCAMHGHGREALKCFESMCEEVVQPNDITFVCLLSACSHAGLVDEGMHLYASMLRDYMISAKSEHYTCMVDLLGRAGHLQEAENIIKAMPCTPSVLHGRLCLVLAEFLKWSRKIPLVMYCCQTSLLLLATGISVRMLKGRERKKVQRNSQVAPGLK
jgi:pentatricopeptide repeat protein